MRKVAVYALYSLEFFLADYVLALEAEIRTLKHKFKTLEKHLEDVLDPLKMSSPHAESQPSVRTSTETTGESASH